MNKYEKLKKEEEGKLALPVSHSLVVSYWESRNEWNPPFQTGQTKRGLGLHLGCWLTNHISMEFKL